MADCSKNDIALTTIVSYILK